jgi:anti-sigma factor RsiW
MTGSLNNEDRALTCRDCVPLLQDYLDGTLTKPGSLEVFLHLRDCAGCQAELEEMKEVQVMLDSLPVLEPPADFDARVLSSVPYAVYREMAPLRQERVPVFLEEEFLPAPLRDARTRVAGGLLAAVGAAGLVAGWLPDPVVIAVTAGIVPEAVVRLQALARRMALRSQRSQTG